MTDEANQWCSTCGNHVPSEGHVPGCANQHHQPPKYDPGRPEAPAPHLDLLRAATVDTDGLLALPPADPLIDGLLDRDSLAVLYGPSGSMKTFLALDLALSVATGSWWQGRAVKPGPVVYVAAEGARGLGARVHAWQLHAKVYGPTGEPIHWVTRAVNLFAAEWAEAFVELCADLKPALVVVDTLARCAVGADENSARDMGRIIDVVDRVRRTTGACVLIVHHTGKDTSAGARGSSAIRAAVDTELEVVATDQRMRIKVTKQKDGPAAAPLRLVGIASGDSLALEADRGQGNPDGLPPSAAAALDALHQIEVPGGITTTTWIAAAEQPERTFYRSRKLLLEAGEVANVGTERAPRYLSTARTQEDEGEF